jgi:hypothetical protein
MLHRSQGASGASVTVRELKRSAEQIGLAAEKRGSAGSSTSKLIRVGD